MVLVYISGLRILIRAPEVPFLAAPKWLKLAKTRNKMRVAIESGKGMKVKVVKLC